MLGHKTEENERAELLLQDLPNSYDQLIINLIKNTQIDSLVFDDIAVSVFNKESRQKKNERKASKFATSGSAIGDEGVINRMWP